MFSLTIPATKEQRPEALTDKKGPETEHVELTMVNPSQNSHSSPTLHPDNEPPQINPCGITVNRPLQVYTRRLQPNPMSKQIHESEPIQGTETHSPSTFLLLLILGSL